MGSSHLSPGQLIGNFRIVRKIAQGGMGEIYEAWDADLQRRIAVKVIRPIEREGAQLGERFRSEARALARLRHPNVVMLYGFGQHEDLTFMAMEYIDGLPLDKFLVTHPCGLPDILRLFRQVVLGLIAAHDAGVIHRDIKPANIVVDRGLTAKIVDFGIAKLHADPDQVQTATNILVGTVNYLAPEIVAGQDATRQSDIYSLGLVLFNMLTGSHPFHGRGNLEVLEKIRSGALTFNPRVDYLLPEAVKDLVFRMTTRSRQARYQDAREVLAALDAVSLDDLPGDLRLSVFPKIGLANADFVRRRCREQGFDSAEIRFIVNLAADIQCRANSGPAASSDSIEISDDSLVEAIRRFLAAKQTLTGKRRLRVRRGRWMAWAGGAAVTAILAFAVSAYGPWWNDGGGGGQVKSGRAPAAVPFKIAPPNPVVGIKAAYMERLMDPASGMIDERVVTWRLERENGGKMIWVSDRGVTQVRLLSPFLPPLNPGGDEFESDHGYHLHGDHESPFPLFPGREAKVTLIPVDDMDQEKAEFAWICRVGEESRLAVAAGEFRVIEVRCEGADGGAVYQYAPLAELVVHSEREIRRGGRRLRVVSELTRPY